DLLPGRSHLSDAQVGVPRCWLEARDQPGAGGQLLRRGIHLYSVLNIESNVRSGERDCASRVCDAGCSGGCAGTSGVARARASSRLARSQISAALRPAGLSPALVVSLLGGIPTEMFVSIYGRSWKERYAARTSERRRRACQRRDDARLLSVSDSVRDPRFRVRHG